MKADDIPFLARDLQNEMPIHTEITAKIPYSFRRFPKDLMEESHKKDDKFLNNHLAEIEEAYHCKLLTKNFIQKFIHQQRRYHLNADILNHDGFFNITNTFVLPTASLNLVNPHRFVVGCIAGAEIIVAAQTSESFNFDGIIYAGLSGTVTVDRCYDNIALNIRVENTASNKRMACYDDVNTILAETGSIAVDGAGFVYESITEFTITQTTIWLAMQIDQGDTHLWFENGTRRTITQAYGAFTTPLGGEVTAARMHMKIQHT